jgi:hypothetical protein
MKITAKEILADKGNIYKNMSEKELNLIIVHRMKQPEDGILFDKFKCDTSIKVAHKLWVKWHYRDGRPKPIRVRHRCERKELDKANKNLEAAMCDVIDLKSKLLKSNDYKIGLMQEKSDLLVKIRNYQSETHIKNLQIIKLQGEVSKAHNTTKIVAFVSLVIIIGLILIPYLN